MLLWCRRSREELERRRAEERERQHAEAKRLVEEKRKREEEEQRRAEEERAQAQREALLLQKQVTHNTRRLVQLLTRLKCSHRTGCSGRRMENNVVLTDHELVHITIETLFIW